MDFYTFETADAKYIGGASVISSLAKKCGVTGVYDYRKTHPSCLFVPMGGDGSRAALEISKTEATERIRLHWGAWNVIGHFSIDPGDDQPLFWYRGKQPEPHVQMKFLRLIAKFLAMEYPKRR